jgi:hypothetical protein
MALWCPDVVETSRAGARAYARHRPETTLLYQLVRENVATFYAEVEAGGSAVPRHVRRAFDTYLECGILAHGFARAYCETCHRNLVVAFSCKGRGVCPSCAARRMYDSAARLTDHVLPERPVRQWVLTLPYSIRGLVAVRGDVLNAVAKVFVEEVFRWQRVQVHAEGKFHGAALLAPQLFGGSINLAPHLHAIFLDGVFAEDASFEQTPRPNAGDLEQVVSRIAARSERWLTRHGYTFNPAAHEREPEFAEQAAQTSLRLGQLATVDAQGRVTPLERRPALRTDYKIKGVAQGFDLHADVSVRDTDREGRERLARYILRPPLVLERLSLTKDGRVAYERKYQSPGATHVVMTPVEFLARLSALVFPPRRPILRFHGAFSAHHKLRARIVPATPPAQRTAPPPNKRKPRVRVEDTAAAAPREPAPPIEPTGSVRGGLALVNKPLDWASLLRRVWQIDALACPCGGRLRFIALVTEPEPVREILVAIGLDPTPPARAPPKQRDFDWS